MTDDVDALFGGRTPPRPSFAERVARPGPPIEMPAPLQVPAVMEPAEAPTASEAYRPYGFLPSNTIGEICEVRRWINGTTTPEGIVFQYRFLMQVAFVGEEMLKLMLPDSIVVIEGRQLGDLRQKLSRRMVSFIQQTNPRIWSNIDPTSPIVSAIEIVRPSELARLPRG